MKRTTASERTLSVYALVLLGEIQRRKLHEDAGFSSMFTYCVVELGYSEANAYRRLQAAGAARNYPEVLTLIKDGSLTVCALSVIAKHLTRENCSRVLNQIEGKSVRVVERLAAYDDLIYASACAVSFSWMIRQAQWRVVERRT